MAKSRAQRKAEKRAREAEEQKLSDSGAGAKRKSESHAQHDTQVPVSGDVAGDRHLGVVLGVRLGLALGAGAGVGKLLLFGFAGALLGLALCAGLSHLPLPRLLVRRVLAAPAAVLAQADPVRRVSPGLVGLVVAPLAV